MQFYAKCAVLQTLCAVVERGLHRLHCLYIAVSNKYSNKAFILSMLARQVHDQMLFLSIAATREMFSSKFSLEQLWC